MPVLPRLRSHLAPVHLGAGVVQLGRDPQDAIVLEGLSPSEAHLLELLDGRCDLSPSPEGLAPFGVPPERVTALLRALGEAGALARGGEPVHLSLAVVGDARLGAAFAEAARACGLPVVEPPAEVEIAVGPMGSTPVPTPGRATLAVQLGHRHVVVGPLVPPAPGPDDPCPACVPPATRVPPTEPADPPAAAVVAAAALVTAHVLPYLQGEPLPVGTTTEVNLATLRTAQYVWPRDPRCVACRGEPVGTVSASA